VFLKSYVGIYVIPVNEKGPQSRGPVPDKGSPP